MRLSISAVGQGCSWLCGTIAMFLAARSYGGDKVANYIRNLRYLMREYPSKVKVRQRAVQG